ncbi:MAG: uroporphyrinogen-III synthase [Melioribacteraceae bacterium]|nr:uroporphyrinogen-III synthase [Melioribacteraceae bacterium]
MKPLILSNILITKKKEELNNNFLELQNFCRNIFYLPTIKVNSIISDAVKEVLFYKIHKYDYLIFTSKNSVEIFAKSFFDIFEKLSNKKIIAIGESTAKKCYEYQIKVDIVPENYSVKGIINYFSDINIVNKLFLIPCSILSTNELKENLEKYGAIVDLIPIYNVETNYDDIDTINKIKNENIDVFIFTSPSSFKNFLTIFEISDIEKFFSNKVICAIGTTTEKSINQYGLNVNVVPKNFSLDHLLDALLKFYDLQKNTV